jgi:elongation factor Ts
VSNDINAGLVAELRRETGAGMMDCKKALAEANGDKAEAIEYLRKKGIAAAEKRADRSAKEGIVAISMSADGQTAALVEVNSETDFVAKNDLFRKFAEDLTAVILNWKEANGKTPDDLADQTLSNGKRAGEVLTDMIGVIGEKLVIGRFARLHVENGYVGTYIHSDNKLGVLVGIKGLTAANPEAKALGRDLAMQIAAASPSYVRREEIAASKIEHERELEIERARNEGKPEPAVAKIADGRVNKWFADVVLLEQPFVKEPKVFIRDYVAEVAKKAGVSVDIVEFSRIRIGA